MSLEPPYSSSRDTKRAELPTHKPEFKSSSKRVSSASNPTPTARLVHAPRHNGRAGRGGARVTPMTPDEYRELLDLYGISQLGASRLLGVNAKTSRNWARYGVTGTAVIILRLFFWDKVSLRDISDAATGTQSSPASSSPQGRPDPRRC
jgi:hypothetical protein